MPRLDPLAEIEDDVTRYFQGLGYSTTWDYNSTSKWYEILKGKSLVCQFDFGVPLIDLYADLPHLLRGRSGRSKSDYTLNCQDKTLLVELYEKMQMFPPIGATR